MKQFDGWGQGAVAGSRGASGWAPATAAESHCAAGRFILTFIEWSSMWDGSFWISGYVILRFHDGYTCMIYVKEGV